MNSLGQVGSRDSPLCGVPCPDHGLLCTRGGVGAADLLWWYAWMRCWQGSCLHNLSLPIGQFYLTFCNLFSMWAWGGYYEHGYGVVGDLCQRPCSWQHGRAAQSRDAESACTVHPRPDPLCHAQGFLVSVHTEQFGVSVFHARWPSRLGRVDISACGSTTFRYGSAFKSRRPSGPASIYMKIPM